MIKLLAKNYSKAVELLCEKLLADNVKYDLLLTGNTASAKKYLTQSVQTSSVLMVGNVGEYSALFAENFNLTMFYDTYAEKNVAEYCKLTQLATPPQHLLDKLCYIPEMFNHYAAVYGYQCGCFGEYNKKRIYILPDDKLECEALYDNYLSKDLLHGQSQMTKYVYKVFGLPKGEVEKRLDKLNKIVLRNCNTENLDSKITLLFPAKCAKSVITQTIEQFHELFRNGIYASSNQTLAQSVVALLSKLGKTISVAESLTGGMLASSIVDVPGSSAVFYEGAVTYSSVAKSKRLEISPHFIDEHSAVSPQVANAMAVGLLKNGTDVTVATTGYAGPQAEGNNPVGLTYIAVAFNGNVAVHKYVFSGDRNAIRQQVTNTALFLVIKTLTK